MVGRSAARHLVSQGAAVVGVSRRDPKLDGVIHVAMDLDDGPACRSVIGGHQAFAGTTHVAYAALVESHDLAGGWRDRSVMERNLAMFRNAVGGLCEVRGGDLRHVSLLQGAKAYGFHVGRSPVPAKERTPRDRHDNFYFLQEDELRRLAEPTGWSWTILRPQVVYGDSFASPMNLIPAIGVYGALHKGRGGPLPFPGSAASIQEGVDARLLARALAWAGRSPQARNEIFNITNGDIFSWADVWPTIADSLGMAAGGTESVVLADQMPPRADEWAAVVDRYRLRSPRSMDDFVGGSWSYADILFGSRGTRPTPALLSTIKIRQAGFADCTDSEDMFREWIEWFQAQRLLPAR